MFQGKIHLTEPYIGRVDIKGRGCIIISVAIYRTFLPIYVCVCDGQYLTIEREQAVVVKSLPYRINNFKLCICWLTF